jgi:hypothetical protein
MKTKLTQVIVVTGTPVEVETSIFTPLHIVISAALRKARISSYPDNWELRDAEGNILSPTLKVGKARQSVNPAAVHAEMFFLSLNAGVGA